MSLHLLVAQDRWQEFDDAWRTQMSSEEPVDDLLKALQLAGDKKRSSRCVGLAKEHATLLEAGGRTADAARILGTVLLSGGNPTELEAELLRCAEAAYAAEPWWEPFRDLTQLTHDSPDLRGPWRAFAKLCAYKTGTVVYHPGGWGAGEITSVDPTECELDVRFWNGRSDCFPMNAAIDIFEPLSESDLRAQYFRDPEGLKKRAKQDPLEVLRVVLHRHNGKATTAVIRNALLQVGIEGSAWSAWWRKARKLAENSEWFEVNGSPQKSVITMLLEAKDPAATLQKALSMAASVAEVHSKVRELFIGQQVEDSIREVGLDALERMAAIETEPLSDRLAAWLLLREHRGGSPEIMRAALADVLEAEPPADPSVAPELFKLFQGLPNARDQERSVEILPELCGDDWIDVAVPHLQHAAPGQVRPLVEAISQAGRKEDLKRHYVALLARPLRAPTLMVALVALFENGQLEGEGVPTPVQRAQALLSLANHLYHSKRGNAHLARVGTRLVERLAGGSNPLLRTLLADCDVNGLRSILMMISRGIDSEIDNLITEIALDTDRQFFAQDMGPFWDGSTIWTTKTGLERRSGELREIREVKIPANEEAIGRAASFGDLSENSEWEAAMEEQRNLTNRAMEMEEELREVDLLENAAMMEDTVCPGMTVQYRETGSGNENQITILGPWDEGTPERPVASYRAPLAAGLLGLHSGDTVTLQLPGGELAIEVLTIEPAEL